MNNEIGGRNLGFKEKILGFFGDDVEDDDVNEMEEEYVKPVKQSTNRTYIQTDNEEDKEKCI